MWQESQKGRKYPVEVLSVDEVRAMLEASSKRGSCGVRDRALIVTLYRSGLRVAEVRSLYPKDVDLSAGTVRVLCGKGGKSRVVGVDGETVEYIEKWLERRSKLGLNGVHPLFCTLAGRTLSRVQITEHLKALAVRAGIEKRVHPHGLRHSFAADLATEKVDIRVIQAALGHSSIATTDRYIRHLMPTAVVDTMKARTW